MGIESKLNAMGIELASSHPNLAKIEPAVRIANLVFTSGQVSQRGEHSFIGKVGKELTLEQGYQGARICAINCLAAIKGVVGDLDCIERVVKVFGMVNAAEGFTQTSQVIDGCTDLINEIFGEAGRHARSAVGLYQLPRNVAVEIEMIVEVRG